MPTPIGIDLGTTYSSISCYKEGRTEIINDAFSERHIPSVVYYDPNSGEKFVGQLAYDKSRQCPQNLLKDSKRLIGRKFNDDMIKKCSQQFLLTETETGMTAYQVKFNNEIVLKKPEEVSADILKYLKDYASEYLKETVSEAVITVPAYFSGAQRKATMTAAELAGLTVLKLMSEPVAAALHYVTDKGVKAKVLVFDFGGGTLDVSLIEVDNHTFEVKAVCGDTLLGGRNIDEDMFKHFYEKGQSDKTMLRNAQKIEEHCISMKERLSSANAVCKLVDLDDDNEDLKLELNILQFEEMNKEIFDRAMNIVKVCLAHGNWKKEDVQQVILVGGSSRIPKIRKMLQELFGEGKIKMDLNPQEAVAHGACLQAAIIRKEGSLEKYKIREVTPLSLGIVCYGNMLDVIIPKNSKIPVQATSSTFYTAENNQISAGFTIVEGERKNCHYNNKLGKFTIADLPQRRAGDVSFTVTFSLDDDGILTVSATENSTGKNNSLSVTMGDLRLSNHQINMNILESQEQKEEDDLFKNFIIHRNNLILECRQKQYDYKENGIDEICQEFIIYVEKLDYKQLDNLNKKFDEFQNKIQPKISRKWR